MAESEFVRAAMSTNFLRQQSRLHTIRARMAALDRAAQAQTPITEQAFASFPSAAVYPPALYLPQTIGIRIAAQFSRKAYVYFYAARLMNAIIGVLLIAAGLCCARSHQLLLILPAVLPISLYQLASVSSDAGVISLTVLFVALSVRFEHSDGIALRTGLFVSLLLVTLGKPVYLPLALLLLGSADRLGLTAAFKLVSKFAALCLISCLAWSYHVKAIAAKPLSDAPGRDPTAQLHSLVAHPTIAFDALLTTLNHTGGNIFLDVIGFLGWFALPLPNWFYLMTITFGLAIAGCLAWNLRAFEFSRVTWATLAGLGIFIGVVLAAYVLWTPPGAAEINGVQGRYFVPVLIALVFAAPPVSSLEVRSAQCVGALSVGFLLCSAFWTVRIVGRYYFSESTVLGKKIHDLYQEAPTTGCPAALEFVWPNRFSFVESGRESSGNPNPRILVADHEDVIIGESDPVLAGSNKTVWRVNTWMPEKAEAVESWLIQDSAACRFARVEVKPQHIPEN